MGGTVCRLRFPVPAADARPPVEDTLRPALEEEARGAPIAAAPQERRRRGGSEA